MAIYRDLNHTTRNKSNLTDLDALYQAAITLLTSKKRTKPFYPEYGGTLEDYLFEPCDDITALKMKYEIDALFSQDPRFELNYTDSDVIPDPQNGRFLLNLKITFPALGPSEYSLNMYVNQKTNGELAYGN